MNPTLPPSHETFQKSVSSALNQKIVRRKTLKKKLEEYKTEHKKLFEAADDDEMMEDDTP
jgi:hypothetical protein